MSLQKIGEFGLIEQFRRKIKIDKSVVVGSGDDCAVMRFDRKYYQLITCDMLVEDVDFLKKDDPYLVGQKAISVSISDIAACGGMPKHCTIAAAFPKNTPLNYVNRLFEGLNKTAQNYGINLVGGDLSASENVVIDVAMLGLVEKKSLVLRSGAKENDILFVTGSIGGSIKKKHLEFSPRIKEARYLVKNYRVNAMIDVSDGLLQDLGHILKASNAGCLLYESLIPVSSSAKNLADALTSGEEFELLFTLGKKEGLDLIRKNFKIFNPIGEIVRKSLGVKILKQNGIIQKLELKGFRHF